MTLKGSVITLYTKPNCVQCMMTKRYLDDRSIIYRTVDISSPDNAAALDELVSRGFKAAPVVHDEETNVWFTGFQPDALAKIISA